MLNPNLLHHEQGSLFCPRQLSWTFLITCRSFVLRWIFFRPPLGHSTILLWREIREAGKGKKKKHLAPRGIRTHHHMIMRRVFYLWVIQPMPQQQLMVVSKQQLIQIGKSRIDFEISKRNWSQIFLFLFFQRNGVKVQERPVLKKVIVGLTTNLFQTFFSPFDSREANSFNLLLGYYSSYQFYENTGLCKCNYCPVLQNFCNSDLCNKMLFQYSHWLLFVGSKETFPSDIFQ